MGSIPLPALDIKTQQQPDLLQKYGQLMQLKNMQTQQQMQQQEAPLRMQQLQQGVQSGQLDLQQKQIALKNQQALTQAYQKWDGKSYEDLAHLALQNGATGETVQTIQQHGLTLRKTASDIAEQDAKTGSDNATTLGKQLDMAAGALNGVLSAPPEQMPQALLSTAQQLAQQKKPDGTPLLDATHLKLAQQLAQQGPQAIAAALPTFAKSLTAFSAQLDAAQKQAATQASQTTAAKNQAESNYYAQNGGAPGVPLATQAANIYAIPESQRTPAQKLFIQGFEKYNNVTKIQPAAARVSMYMQMPQAVVDPNDPSREIYTTKRAALGMEAPASGAAAGARAVIKSAIGGKLGDTINSYNTASAHLDLLSQTADALNDGNVQALNKIGNEFNRQTGNPAPTNFQAVKDAVAGEVSKTFKGGQATDAEIKQAEEAISSAGSPAQLKGVINTYKALMASKRDAIKQQVEQGAHGKVNYGEQSASPAPTSHAFSIGAWHQANPNGDLNAAKAAAQQAGYQVVP